MAYFPKYSTFFNLQKPINFWKFEQNSRSQNERKVSVLRKFLSILRLARMFYIIYTTFLQVGKLRLHKLCQNKHFSTAGMIRLIQEEKHFLDL